MYFVKCSAFKIRAIRKKKLLLSMVISPLIISNSRVPVYFQQYYFVGLCHKFYFERFFILES